MNAQYRQVSLEPRSEETMAWVRTACIILAIVLGSVGNAYFTVAVAKSQVRDAMRETFKDMPMARVAR
ncbi:MAG: hypothetical protein ACR2NI_03085 [Pirellulales bacterium]